MPSVKPRINPKNKNVEPFDRMLRRFKKQCERANIVNEVRDRQYYEKPNQKKHKKNQDREALAQSRRKWGPLG